MGSVSCECTLALGIYFRKVIHLSLGLVFSFPVCLANTTRFCQKFFPLGLFLFSNMRKK